MLVILITIELLCIKSTLVCEHYYMIGHAKNDLSKLEYMYVLL